jgi:nitrogen fixation NifU-like protein
LKEKANKSAYVTTAVYINWVTQLCAFYLYLPSIRQIFSFFCCGPGDVGSADVAGISSLTYTFIAMHSKSVLDHFHNPRNAGDLPGASATAQVTNPVCGDILQLSVSVEEGRIVRARFKAQGCVAAIAAGSVLTGLLEGKTLADARAITPRMISDQLGGLPESTYHAAQLSGDALALVLEKIS